MKELHTGNYGSHHLARLKPELIGVGSARDVLEFALTYVERCRGDVPLLEREREVLLAALEHAWQQEEYAQVVQLVTGLAHLAGRLDNFQEARRVLQRGIYACQHVQDEHSLRYFQSCLSGLLWSAGDYERAYRIWWESFAGDGAPGYLWEPLRNVVHLTDIVGANGIVSDFASMLLNGGRSENSGSTALMLFMRAFYARLSDDMDVAYDNLSLCLQALSKQDTAVSSYKPFFEILVQTELARVRGDYTCSQAYAEAAITLAQAFCDPYSVAVLIWDQALFSYFHGKSDDLYLLALRLAEVTSRLAAPHVRQWNVFLQQQPGVQLIAPVEEVGKRCRNSWLQEPLSRSEVAVLHLLADGLSNQEIATGLFVAVGTVKKHIEHIYSKLDVHSRVQAVARASMLGLLE